jgi:hypothetical protein
MSIFTESSLRNNKETKFLVRLRDKLKKDVGIPNHITYINYNDVNGTHFFNIHDEDSINSMFGRDVIEVYCNYKLELYVRSTLTTEMYRIDNFNHLVNVLVVHKNMFSLETISKIKPYVRKKRLLEFLKED